MPHLTKEERIVLVVLVCTLAAGCGLKFFFKGRPAVEESISFMDSGQVYRKVNLNKASLEELVDIPYIGEFTAQRIIEFRRENGQFTSLGQLKNLPGIKEKNFNKFVRYLKV